MKVTSELNRLRMAPRKVRIVADAIRGQRVAEAEVTLRFLTRRAAGPLAKLLRAAAASASHDFNVSAPEDLVITEIRVDAGPTLRRSEPRAFGRSAPIRKRTSRVRLVLEGRGKPRERRAAQPAAVAVAPSQTDTDAFRRRRAPDRDAPRDRLPKLRPAGFVRRMFRRKAI